MLLDPRGGLAVMGIQGMLHLTALPPDLDNSLEHLGDEHLNEHLTCVVGNIGRLFKGFGKVLAWRAVQQSEKQI